MALDSFEVKHQPHLLLEPTLETGDRLSREVFERRFRAMPGLKKAELIGGIVYVASPVSQRHAMAHAELTAVVCTYAAHTPGLCCGNNGSVRLDEQNEVQPDVLLWRPRTSAAGPKTSSYLEFAPELVAEVAATTASYDLHMKLDLYRAHGVREYLVWRVVDGAIDWFSLDKGEYRPLAADDQGIIRSTEFSGLWLDTRGLLAGKMDQVLATLERGLASPEHAAFIASGQGTS